MPGLLVLARPIYQLSYHCLHTCCCHCRPQSMVLLYIVPAACPCSYYQGSDPMQYPLHFHYLHCCSCLLYRDYLLLSGITHRTRGPVCARYHYTCVGIVTYSIRGCQGRYCGLYPDINHCVISRTLVVATAVDCPWCYRILYKLLVCARKSQTNLLKIMYWFVKDFYLKRKSVLSSSRKALRKLISINKISLSILWR